MNDFLEILRREVDNPDRLYLYHEAGGWCAYEQSACRLMQVVGECIIERVINLTYEVVLIRAQISVERLESVLEYFPCLSPELLVCDTHIEIPVRWQSHVVFDTWKQTELEACRSCIKFERA